ncbi:MFS multidrug transporter-like protein [Mollisia scopiformis]|uniref:MFS multidrug transporter-like protein n=1 Tax=Mollisia scopiformis TaxID=149040 RepID=A0A194X0S4_MOLSC|nr:MFS multidrug transporter-like protein [Mollisia scopiformis]KUJ13801.1 MFS multidrug transporter-like protein [Mollisia scopiformis]
MEAIERFLSRPTAKPYRSHALERTTKPFLNENGHLDFAPNDIENPKNWSAPRRWYITVVSVLLVVNATFASSSPSGCLDGIALHFGVSEEAAGLVITLFLLGYCFGPLFWAPLSEFFGRRYIFYVSFTLYLAFNFLCAFANNFAPLLVGRFLTGTFASSPLSNAPGVLADIWGPVERGNAMSLFAMMTFMGPALGPVISGFLELKEDWRWNFYVLLWLGGISELLMFTIPETLPPIVLMNKAKRLRKLKIPGYEDVKAPVEATDRSLGGIFKVALTRPWKILIDPISLFVAIYLSVVYTLLYMLFTIYPIVFQQKRGWNSGVGELPLIGTVLGAGIGGMLIFVNSARDRKKLEAGHKGTPEDRLPVAMVGGVLFPITMFWFAWSAEYDSIPWIVPTLAGVFLSTSILLIFVAYLNYLTDTYLMFAASALAANTVCRSGCGAAAPLFTQYMFDALGVGGGGSLIGGVATLLAPIPFIFYKYGGPIRERSKFAPTPSSKSGVQQVVPREQNVNHPSSSTLDTSEDSDTYSREGGGIDRVARPNDTRETDIGQLEGLREVDPEKDMLPGPREDDPEKDLEKGRHKWLYQYQLH